MTNTAQTPPPEDPPMEIHKPKPIHNWREFIKEVGIIVLGACIVLSAASGAFSALFHRIDAQPSGEITE